MRAESGMKSWLLPNLEPLELTAQYSVAVSVLRNFFRNMQESSPTIVIKLEV